MEDGYWEGGRMEGRGEQKIDQRMGGKNEKEGGERKRMGERNEGKDGNRNRRGDDRWEGREGRV